MMLRAGLGSQGLPWPNWCSKLYRPGCKVFSACATPAALRWLSFHVSTVSLISRQQFCTFLMFMAAY